MQPAAHRLGRPLVGVHSRPGFQDRDRPLAHRDRPLHRVAVVSLEGIRRQQLLRRQRAVAQSGPTRPCWPPSTTWAPAPAGRWRLGESYRTHGDHFIFNQTNPARCRTTGTARTPCSPRWLDRGRPGAAAPPSASRGRRLDPLVQPRRPLDGAAERLWRVAPADRPDRADRRDAAGGPLQRVRHVVEPVAQAPAGGRRRVLRLRASVGRAFRVPTFTERYYSDPANLARADVGPEHAWAGRAGPTCSSLATGRCTRTLFGPCRQRRDRLAAPVAGRALADLQRARRRYQGIELSVSRSIAARRLRAGGLHRARPRCLRRWTSCRSDVLDYAPHSLHRRRVDSAARPAAAGAALRVRERRRPYPQPAGGVAVGDRDYALFDLPPRRAASRRTTRWRSRAPTSSTSATRRSPAWRCPARSGPRPRSGEVAPG